ncbi:hypothetical protein HOLleu_33863 [Holothuria leucospilota]|uniref:Coiled-coil protein 142 C-terminal domain-containing protein n=1 Tax=Holothuria leucospilota TaxID=206669 RepID=A0A9Q0YTX9_HOLLE|nr:hypothetical protein HOLleu_33863 [Holothuria leucospilota]
MEFAPAADIPYRRLPPLQMIHGQPVLDLDTPPPSSNSSPVTTPRDTKTFKKSVLPQFTNEEISHSLHILQQCFEVLEPGHFPCLKSRGRVSSAFGHNKYSITLARLYGRLGDIRVEQAKLLFYRDCASRLSQLIEFTHSIQSLVQDEERTLLDFLSGKDSDPHTKLEFLPVVCEELRLHLNHIPSIQHRLHTDRWLQPAVPQIFRHVHKFDQILRQLQQSAITWLHKLISTGFKVYSYFHVSMLSEDLVKSIVSSVEDFNRLFKQFQLQLSQHPCGDACLCDFQGASNFYPVSKEADFLKLKPFKCEVLLESIASCRAKVTAFRTFYFIMANSKLLTALKDKQDAFDWKLAYQKLSSQNEAREGLWFGRSGGRYIPRSLEINFVASDSPLKGVIASEEEFVVKLLTAAATSSGLLQKLKLKRANQSRDDKDDGVVESVSVKLVPSESAPPQTNQTSSKKNTSRFKRDSLARKSVRWGDSLNAQVKRMLLNVYFEEFWRTFGVHLAEYFNDPCMGTKGDVDVDLLGSTMVWDDENLYMLLCAIEKFVATKEDFPVRASSMFVQFCSNLFTIAAKSAWDDAYCAALGSSLKDKCLHPSQDNSDEEGTTTCHLFISSLSPVLAGLSSFIASEKRDSNSVTATAEISQTWSTRRSHLQLILLDAAVNTLAAMATWCRVQSSQFLSSWKVQQFLLITQGDLKLATDYAVNVLKICSSLPVEVKPTEKSAASVRDLQMRAKKRILEDIISKLHGMSSWSGSQFAKDCQKMCEEFWPQAMPLGKEWRRKTTNIPPSEHNQYAEVAVSTLLIPVTEGVSHLKATTQITVVSMAVTKMLDTWMSFILKEKPKFSLHGACQLEQDLNYVHMWLASDASGLKPDSKQSILALDALRNFQGAVQLLKFQSPGKLGMGHSASKDELTSEYSVSTAPSDTHKDSVAMSDGSATFTPPIRRAKGHPLAGRNSDPGKLALRDKSESGSEEDLVQVPRKKEWLSLRVHQGNRWKLSFNCLNNNDEEI